METFEKGETYLKSIEFDPSNLCEGIYYFKLFIFANDNIGNAFDLDGAMAELYFKIIEAEGNKTIWKQNYWGNVRLNQIKIIGD